MCAETGEGGDSERRRWSKTVHLGRGGGGGADLIERGFGRKRTWRLKIIYKAFLSYFLGSSTQRSPQDDH